MIRFFFYNTMKTSTFFLSPYIFPAVHVRHGFSVVKIDGAFFPSCKQIYIGIWLGRVFLPDICGIAKRDRRFVACKTWFMSGSVQRTIEYGSRFNWLEIFWSFRKSEHSTHILFISNTHNINAMILVILVILVISSKLIMFVDFDLVCGKQCSHKSFQMKKSIELTP